jgi:hypothetical protein
MLEISFLTCAVFISGAAFLPTMILRSGPTLAFGMTLLVAFGSFISIFAGINVGTSMLIGLFLGLCLFSYRFYFSDVFRVNATKLFFSQTIPILLFGIVFSAILSKFEVEFASRNFDASYAIQDSIYLAENSANQSQTVGTDFLPLSWSASTKDRYGVSFILAMLSKLEISNVWWSAKYVMVFLMLLLILTVLLLVRQLFNTTGIETVIIGFFLLVSPSILLPIQYFMFGQVLGLIISFAIMHFLIQSSEFKPLLYLSVFSLVILFISYPAMAFPMVLLFCIFALLSPLQGDSILERVKTLLKHIFFALLLLFVSYGFRIQIVIERIWAWISGVLFPTQDPEDLSPLQTTIFGQYGSKLGLPLFVGAIKYPNFDLLSTYMLAILLALSLWQIYLFFFSRKFTTKNHGLNVLIAFYFSWILMALISYIKDSAYVFFKFSTWIMPLILAVNVLLVLRVMLNKGNNFSKTFRLLAISLGLPGLLLVSITGTQHLAQIKIWNSFSQTAKTAIFPSLDSTQLLGTGKIYLATPTVEEAVWLSGLMGSVDQKRFLSLGPTSQALGGALTTSCKSGGGLVRFDSSDLILQDSKLLDIAPPLQFYSLPRAVVGTIAINRSDQLKAGIVLNSGGLYPPEMSLADDGETKNAFRWSTGQLCFSLYSDDLRTRSIQIDFDSGPDISELEPWITSVDNKGVSNRSTNNHVKFVFEAMPGWNTVQVRQPGCYTEMRDRQGRWTLRADDRGLCLKISRITVN